MAQLSAQFQTGHYLSVEDHREAWYVRRDNLVVSLQAHVMVGAEAEQMLKFAPFENDKTLLSVTPTDGGAWMFSDLGQHWSEEGHQDYRTKDCPFWPRKGCWYGGSTLMAMRVARMWSDHNFGDWIYESLAELWEEIHAT